MEISHTLLTLKEEGMDVRMLWGDHEVGLKALTSDPIELSEEGHLLVQNWFFAQVTTTMKEMENWYDTMHGPDSVTPTTGEQGWIAAKQYNDKYYDDCDRRQLLIARRLCTGNGPVARLFASLEAVTMQDDLLYMHALPNEYWTRLLYEGARQQGVMRANERFHQLLNDPPMLHKMAFGEMQYTKEGMGDPSQPVIRPTEASILWSRFNAHASLAPGVGEILSRKGWAGMVRGHDPQSDGHTAHDVNGFVVINADLALQIGKKRGYTRISRDGRVMGWTGSE